MAGWIKLHRKLLQSLIFGNEKGLKVWLWCLLKATHTKYDVLIGRTKVTLQAGQFIMGSNKAVDELKLARSTIWYWLSLLEKEGQVVLQKNARYTVVTLLNWEEYQHDLDAGETLAKRQVDTYKNEEKIKNVNTSESEIRAVEGSEEDTPVKTSTAKYPHSKEVFSWFPRPQASWNAGRNVQEREYAEYLYKRGEKVVKAVLAFVEDQKANNAEFKFTVVKPSDLEKKWEDIRNWKLKHGL